MHLLSMDLEYCNYSKVPLVKVMILINAIFYKNKSQKTCHYNLYLKITIINLMYKILKKSHFMACFKHLPKHMFRYVSKNSLPLD